MSVNLLRTTEFRGVLILKIPLSDKNFDGIPGEERKKTMENSRGLMKILMEFYSFVLKIENWKYGLFLPIVTYFYIIIKVFQCKGARVFIISRNVLNHLCWKSIVCFQFQSFLYGVTLMALLLFKRMYFFKLLRNCPAAKF